jgi:hypothetical protein
VGGWGVITVVTSNERGGTGGFVDRPGVRLVEGLETWELGTPATILHQFRAGPVNMAFAFASPFCGTVVLNKRLASMYGGCCYVVTSASKG